MSDKIKKGKLITTNTIWCVSTRGLHISPDCIKSVADEREKWDLAHRAKKDGWAETKVFGWVCPACKQGMIEEQLR